jgi:hypothetical protein
MLSIPVLGRRRPGARNPLLTGYHVPALTSADNNYAPNATVLAIAERAAGLIMSR